MGQSEILKFLKDQYKINPERTFTSKEIEQALGKSASRPLMQLRKHNEVVYYKDGSRHYQYSHKTDEDALSKLFSRKTRI